MGGLEGRYCYTTCLIDGLVNMTSDLIWSGCLQRKHVKILCSLRIRFLLALLIVIGQIP